MDLSRGFHKIFRTILFISAICPRLRFVSVSDLESIRNTLTGFNRNWYSIVGVCWISIRLCIWVHGS